MDITETLNEGLKRAYRITLPAAELDAKVDQKLREAQPDIQMKGFRKGKVPLALLRRQFGERLMGEVMQEAIDEALRKHFEESGDKPAGQPQVRMENEDWKPGEDVVVALSYENLPEMPEVDFSGIELERLVVSIDDAEVEKALERLAEEARSYEDREEGAAAEEGDQVVIDFVGRIDGEAFEGGAAEDYPLVLGSGAFIPGFEEQLVGAKAGETRDVRITFPEDYGNKDLAGKEAVFEVKVKAVKAPKAAEIDDELAKRYSAENLEALRAQIRERLAAEYADAARQIMQRRLLDKLDEMLDFELPPSLVEAEAKQIAHQLWHEEHPEEHGHEHGEIEPTEEHEKLARRRVKLGLFLAEVGRRHDITVSEEELTRALMEEARRYPGQEAAFFQWVQQNPEVQAQIRAPIFEQKVVDFIFELAKVTEREVSKDELEKEIEALNAD